MRKIIVASQNPVKIEAVRRGFEKMFPQEAFSLESVEVSSGVSRQPLTESETQKGAQQRALHAARTRPAADFWVGIEGGVEDHAGQMASFAWVVVRSRERQGVSRTGTFFLPPAVARLVRQGMELGEADDKVFGKTNSKQANGAVGLLTGDVVVRAQLYEQAVILALVGIKNPDLYPPIF